MIYPTLLHQVHPMEEAAWPSLSAEICPLCSLSSYLSDSLEGVRLQVWSRDAVTRPLHDRWCSFRSLLLLHAVTAHIKEWVMVHSAYYLVSILSPGTPTSYYVISLLLFYSPKSSAGSRMTHFPGLILAQDSREGYTWLCQKEPESCWDTGEPPWFLVIMFIFRKHEWDIQWVLTSGSLK